MKYLCDNNDCPTCRRMDLQKARTAYEKAARRAENARRTKSFGLAIDRRTVAARRLLDAQVAYDLALDSMEEEVGSFVL